MSLIRELRTRCASYKELERRRDSELINTANELRLVAYRDGDEHAHVLADAHINRLRARAETEAQIERLKERAARRAKRLGL
jgi:hypothetical protein